MENTTLPNNNINIQIKPRSKNYFTILKEYQQKQDTLQIPTKSDTKPKTTPKLRQFIYNTYSTKLSSYYNRNKSNINFYGNHKYEEYQIEAWIKEMFHYKKTILERIKKNPIQLNRNYPVNNTENESFIWTPLPDMQRKKLKSENDKTEFSHAERTAVVMRIVEYSDSLSTRANKTKKIKEETEIMIVMKNAIAQIEKFWWENKDNQGRNYLRFVKWLRRSIKKKVISRINDYLIKVKNEKFERFIKGMEVDSPNDLNIYYEGCERINKTWAVTSYYCSKYLYQGVNQDISRVVSLQQYWKSLRIRLENKKMFVLKARKDRYDKEKNEIIKQSIAWPQAVQTKTIVKIDKLRVIQRRWIISFYKSQARWNVLQCSQQEDCNQAMVMAIKAINSYVITKEIRNNLTMITKQKPSFINHNFFTKKKRNTTSSLTSACLPLNIASESQFEVLCKASDQSITLLIQTITHCYFTTLIHQLKNIYNSRMKIEFILSSLHKKLTLKHYLWAFYRNTHTIYHTHKTINRSLKAQSKRKKCFRYHNVHNNIIVFNPKLNMYVAQQATQILHLLQYKEGFKRIKLKYYIDKIERFKRLISSKAKYTWLYRWCLNKLSTDNINLNNKHCFDLIKYSSIHSRMYTQWLEKILTWDITDNNTYRDTTLNFSEFIKLFFKRDSRQKEIRVNISKNKYCSDLENKSEVNENDDTVICEKLKLSTDVPNNVLKDLKTINKKRDNYISFWNENMKINNKWIKNISQDSFFGDQCSVSYCQKSARIRLGTESSVNYSDVVGNSNYSDN